MKIISGSSNLELARRIALELNASILNTIINNFNDGELRIEIQDNISHEHEIIIIQSTSHPANNHLMELFLLADTVKRVGVKNITVVIPYFGYSRQDRCTYNYGPISASLVIKMIETSGINKVVTLDLHSAQLEGMFNVPIKNLDSASLFLPIYKASNNNSNIIVVSPDIGGISRARNFCSLFGTNLAIINKSRDKNNQYSMSEIIGKVEGKRCIIVDDIVDSATTLCMATELLLKNGAVEVEAFITHAVLSGNAANKINQSAINKIYTTDSISHTKLPSKFGVLPIHELISTAL